MSVYETLIQDLSAAKIFSPRLEARKILAYVLEQDETEVSVLNVDLTSEQQQKLKEICERRIKNQEPLDKILGQKGFYKYDFIVNNQVLSPRPETEILVEEACRLSGLKRISILDLGIGSGCILLSILKDNPMACGTGVDISAEALKIAAINAQNLQVTSRLKLKRADWFCDNFLQVVTEKFDLIVSNPPYVPQDEIAELQPEVRKHDPFLALSGGKDGLDSYQRLAELIPLLLNEGGYVLLECGAGQAQSVADIFQKHNLSLCKIVKDLQGIDRCIILKK